MSTGKLKPQYNRVRTSTALHTTSIWSNTIGVQSEQAGSNQAIEASIYAPGGGGFGRAAKRQRAQELIEATGYQPAVRDFEGLKALARSQGGDAGGSRGACKMCGGLGHLTKQCRNFLSSSSAPGGSEAAAAAAAGGTSGERGLLTAEAEEALLADSSSMDSSDLGSRSDGSDSDSSSGDRARKRKRSRGSSKKDKDKDKERSRKSKQKKRKKEKKEKRDKKERSRREHGGSGKHGKRDRSRSRSRSRERKHERA